METYIVSVVSVLLGYITSRVANRNVSGILPHVAVIFLLTVAAVVLTLAGQWFVKPPPTPPNRLEGQWLEKYKEGENQIYAIATIRHNPSANHLEFYGNSYDVNLKIVGRWRTLQARLDRDQYDYLFEGESWNPDKARQGLRKGVGGIYFDTASHGKGKFLSIKDDHEPRDLELYKILDEDAAQQSIKDPTGLIQKLYADPSYFNKVTSAH
jgi:hypothetical protein